MKHNKKFWIGDEGVRYDFYDPELGTYFNALSPEVSACPLDHVVYLLLQ